MISAWILPVVAVAFGLALAFALRARTEARAASIRMAELERLDEARLRFFANIAHELRSPLTLLQSQLGSAESEESRATRSRQIRRAMRSASRLLRLADQALEMSRLDAGVVTPQSQSIDVVPFLDALVLTFSELAERNGVLLEFVSRPRSIHCRIDPEHLTSMVTNLLSNAFKFTPHGGRVGVAVEALQSDSGNPILCITVADTGKGIDASELDRIFERFARSESGASEGGAGIGLALSRELARLYDGDLRVRSESGRGAQFKLTLPVLETSTEATGQAIDVPVPDRSAITPEMHYRTTGSKEEPPQQPIEEGPAILIADDDPSLRNWLVDVLGELGNVTPLADGNEVVRQARDSIPDLIVTDARMDSMHGSELCRVIRSDERTSHIPIIMVSGLTTVDDRIAGIEAGADEYLTKPVDPRELVTRARAIIHRRREILERSEGHLSLTPSALELQPLDEAFLQKTRATIEAEMEEPEFSVQELADSLALSTSQLTRKLRAITGRTPGQLIRSFRLQRAADMLASNAGTIAEIAYRVGFSDQSHFSRAFKKEFGSAPSEYKRAKVERVVT